MILNHYGVEFGYELIAVIPYAYHHRGQLTSTISLPDTNSLYYFSPDHREDLVKRHFGHTAQCLKEGTFPNMMIHRSKLDLSMWTPPPFKENYKNSDFDFEVVVCNKYNREWNGDPINYYSLEDLERLFIKLKGRKVLYNHMTTEMGNDDTVPSLDLGEWDLVKSYGITTVQDVMGYSYNETQMKIYANAKLFITVQGGSSIFASYFGGTNLIYAKAGQELSHNSYSWYNLFGGSDVRHSNDINEILEWV